MIERRRQDRVFLNIFSRVFDRGSGRVLGNLSDLSRMGAMIISDAPVPAKKMYNVRFELPDPQLFSADHLDVDVRVAWCSPDIDPTLYNIGFEFYSINEQENRIIMNMIKTYEFRRVPPDYPTPPSLLM